MSTAVTGDLGPMAPRPLEEANGGALQEADRFERSSTNVDQNLISKSFGKVAFAKNFDKKPGKVLTKIKYSTSPPPKDLGRDRSREPVIYSASQ